MKKDYKITHTELSDIPLIHQLFESSILYQEKKGYTSWRNYDKTVVGRDVTSGNQYKVIIDSQVAIVFTVLYKDPVIWREMDQGKSIYLHRIVINPAFKGQRLFGIILDWSKKHIKTKGLQSIRMDTWATNPNIIEYYKSFGFVVVENYTTPNSDELPAHNRNLALTLLESV